MVALTVLASFGNATPQLRRQGLPRGSANDFERTSIQSVPQRQGQSNLSNLFIKQNFSDIPQSRLAEPQQI